MLFEMLDFDSGFRLGVLVFYADVCASELNPALVANYPH